MSYEPTNWKTGDVVTSQKLNKLEQGVAGAGGVFVVHATKDPDAQVPNTLITQETAGEVEEAFLSNKAIIICIKDLDDGYAECDTMGCAFAKDETADHLYTLHTLSGPVTMSFTADTSNEVFTSVPNA